MNKFFPAPIVASALCALANVSDAAIGRECWQIAEASFLIHNGTAAGREHASASCQSALERNADGQTTKWYLTETMTFGQIKPINSYNINGLICREYEISIGKIDGATIQIKTNKATACRFSDYWWAWPTTIPDDLKKDENSSGSGQFQKN